MGVSTEYVSETALYNPLYRKKWCVIGDSFTNDFSPCPPEWAFSDGPFKGESRVYAKIIASRNSMKLQWMAKNGRTLAFPAEGSFSNSFCGEELYKKIDPDVDYITIMLGINDSHHAPHSIGDDGEEKIGTIPLGDSEDKSIYTFYGAWDTVLRYILENYPRARVGIIVTNGLDFNSHRLATISMARKYGLPYIDLNGDERTPAFHRTQNPDIPKEVREVLMKRYALGISPEIRALGTVGEENTHPNALCHEIEADIVENFLHSL